MKTEIKSYLYFLAFMAVTKLVVAPVAAKLNVPLVGKILG